MATLLRFLGMQQAINIPNDAHNHDYMCASDGPGDTRTQLEALGFFFSIFAIFEKFLKLRMKV